MANITGINSITYIDKKKLQTKLSFNSGEKFSAKICKIDKDSGEAVLRLPNGWEFNAEVEDSLEHMEGKILKFQVKDFSEGKLQLKIAAIEEKLNIKDSLGKILNSLGLENTEENIELLNNMLKHNITLSKDNIMDMKNVFELKQKIELPENQERFIKLLIEKEGIDLNSVEGKLDYEILKDFFEVLKNVDEELLLSLKENGIELSKENIDSLMELNDNSGVIVDNLKQIGEVISKLNNKTENITLKENSGIGENVKGNNIDKVLQKTDEEGMNVNKENFVNNQESVYKDTNILSKNIEENSNKENIINKNLENNTKSNNINNEGLNNENNKENIENINNFKKDIDGNIQTKSSNQSINVKNSIIENSSNLKENVFINNNLKELIENTTNNEVKKLLIMGEQVKEEIKDNISQIKDSIKTIIESTKDDSKTNQKLILNELKAPFNNLKVYNSISNEYYYLDTPLNIKENEYPFKLIIKNNNKKNKQIDSKSVKIVASVKTINMGTIDNYISINNQFMEVKISVNKKYIKLFNKFKSNLEEGLDSIGYLSMVIIEERKEEMNLIKSSEFFEDANFNTINTLI